jgi:hypothetical protein
MIETAGRLFGFLFSSLCIASCSSDDASPIRATQDAVVLPVDGTTPETGCTTVRRATTSAGCAGTWQCAAPNLRDFLCAASDGGLSCACTEGDASVRVQTPAGCSDESEVSALAQRLCGWEVP